MKTKIYQVIDTRNGEVLLTGSLFDCQVAVSTLPDHFTIWDGRM